MRAERDVDAQFVAASVMMRRSSGSTPSNIWNSSHPPACRIPGSWPVPRTRASLVGGDADVRSADEEDPKRVHVRSAEISRSSYATGGFTVNALAQPDAGALGARGRHSPKACAASEFA